MQIFFNFPKFQISITSEIFSAEMVGKYLRHKSHLIAEYDFFRVRSPKFNIEIEGATLLTQ